MPWWVWLVLVLFMLVMIVSGIVYACLHGYHAFKDMARLGECAAKRIDAMGKPLPCQNENDTPFSLGLYRMLPSATRMPMLKSSKGVRRIAIAMPNSGRNGVILMIDLTKL